MKHLFIAEAQNAAAVLGQPLRLSLIVIPLSCVDCPIYLDYQTVRCAIKIDDEQAKRVLAAKVQPGETITA
jgi:hypothetical protein